MRTLVLTTFSLVFVILTSAHKLAANPGDIIRNVPTQIIPCAAVRVLWYTVINPANPELMLRECVHAIVKTFYPSPSLPLPVEEIIVSIVPDKPALVSFTAPTQFGIRILLGENILQAMNGVLKNDGYLANEFFGAMDFGVAYLMFSRKPSEAVRTGLAVAFQILQHHPSLFWELRKGTFEEGYEFAGRFFVHLFEKYSLASLERFQEMLMDGYTIDDIFSYCCARQTLKTLWAEYESGKAA